MTESEQNASNNQHEKWSNVLLQDALYKQKCQWFPEIDFFLSNKYVAIC